MITLIVGMLLCVALAVGVVGLVAVPARREGRDVLTPHGEKVVAKVRERTGTAVEVALERTGSAVEVAREKTGDVIASAREKVADAGAKDQDREQDLDTDISTPKAS